MIKCIAYINLLYIIFNMFLLFKEKTFKIISLNIHLVNFAILKMKNSCDIMKSRLNKDLMR